MRVCLFRRHSVPLISHWTWTVDLIFIISNLCGGILMKKLAVIATSMFLAGAAHAADMSMPVKAVAPAPEPMWDVAFGVTLTSDYVFRGISQTNNNPALQGYVELDLFDWFYFNVWGSNQNWAGNFLVNGDSSLEVDFAGGIRHTWGAFGLDVGAIYYTFPGGSDIFGVSPTDFNYWEIYAKPSYAVTDWLSIGAALNWTSDMYASGTDGTALSANFKATAASLFGSTDIGAYLSGEYGYQWLSDTAYNYTNFFGAFVGISGYSWWNIGVGLTYKAATLDLRYSGSDLDAASCGVIIGATNACGDKFIASLSFATSFNALK